MLTIRRNHIVEIFDEKGRLSHKDSVVCCFKHAIQLALEGEIIEEEVDEFGRSEYDMRTTTCFYCERGMTMPIGGVIACKNVIK